MKTRQNASFYKRLLVSLLTIGVALHLSGCSTSSSSEETASGGDETFAEESEGDFSEDGTVAEESSSEDSNKDSLDESGGDLGDDLGDEVADAEKKEPGDDMSLDEEGGDAVADNKASTDELSLDDEQGLPDDVAQNAAPAEPAPDAAQDAPPPTDAPVFAEQTPPADATPVADAPPPVDTATEAPMAPSGQAWLPLRKMKTAAFAAGDSNLNRVYLARAGDTRQSVATKVYGDKKRAKDLLKWNSFLSRGMKTGDKVYYQSATNPTDANMLTYYEDVGIPAQTYTSKDGDNIRTVSKSLLGADDSWKEVWATNLEVESKGDIPAGLSIRYWPDGGVAAPTMAAAEAPPADALSAPPQDPAAAPPAADPLAMNTATDPMLNPTAAPPADPLAPPPMPPSEPLAAAPTATPASDPMAAGTAAIPPSEPPPPPPAEVAQAQTEPEPTAATATAGTEEADNMMMMGLSGIILLAAGAVLVMIKRNKSRKVDLTQTTQVG